MDDMDRQVIRARVQWQKYQKLGVQSVVCTCCCETDPICFIGKLATAKREGHALYATCERCSQKSNAPTDTASIAGKWASLEAKGVTNRRCHCGEDNPFCFEADHIAGRASTDDVVGICINCHLKRTSRQLTEYPADAFDPRSVVIQMRNTLRGIIDHLELAMMHLRRVEEFLDKIAAGELTIHRD